MTIIGPSAAADRGGARAVRYNAPPPSAPARYKQRVTARPGRPKGTAGNY